jgi:carbamoyl-phosphate synthase large subunit
MEIAQDKQQTQLRLRTEGIPVAETRLVTKAPDIKAAFREMRSPLWVRARHGAGGRLSLLCNSADEAGNWIELWVRRGTPISEFMIQDYLPGRNVAWDSLWREGELITSYCRERLEYPFKHISPSGITGTPSVARSIHDRRIDRIAEKGVRAISPKPTGAFAVDIKEDSGGRPAVTEVDAGKFHTTMPLWGYVAFRHLKLPWYSNLADLYVRLGLGENVDEEMPRYNLIPAGYYLIRNIDSGVLLWREDGWRERVL